VNHTAAPRPPAQRLPAPRRIGLLLHPNRDQSPGLAEEMAEQLRAWGAEPVSGYLEDERDRARLLEQELLVVLGGDGTLLRVGHEAGPRGIPMLGVNLGRLGFLSEVQPAEWRSVLARVLAGDYWLEDRTMLRAQLQRGGETFAEFHLLNEGVVGRGQLARPVRLVTEVDGGRLATYVADGLIAATATGSTAYALAVGGPVLPPGLKNLLLIPIAPHLSLERAIVLAEGARLRIEVHSDQPAVFSGDGQYELTMHDGDAVLVETSPHVCRFVRVQDPMYFYHTLLRRMRREGPNHDEP
jgi:NAD+ kinase